MLFALPEPTMFIAVVAVLLMVKSFEPKFNIPEVKDNTPLFGNERAPDKLTRKPEAFMLKLVGYVPPAGNSTPVVKFVVVLL